MKKTGLLVCLLFLAAVPGFCEAGKVVPSFNITSTETDSTLKPNQVKYVFHIYTEGDTLKNDTIRFGYGTKEKKIVTNERGVATVRIPSGTYPKFQFYYNRRYVEIETDTILAKPYTRVTAYVNFSDAYEPRPVKKPVIYVYPEKTTAVEIKLDVKGTLDFTYPQYHNGWAFTADPNGTIAMNGKQYDYLFWDGTADFATKNINANEGFVVKKDSLVPFFENKLSAMGLSPREAQDFITFWCPLMAVNETNFVHFEFTKGYDQFAEIAITPKPDNLFRLFMVWSNANGLDAATVKPQQMEKVNRSGFTVIEWGGSEVDFKVLNKNN